MSSAHIALETIAERVEAMHLQSEAELRSRAGTETMFQLLRDKISGLPHVDVATIVGADGAVISYSRAFPPPQINLSDRDYFQAHQNNRALELFVSIPVHNKGNGKWVFYLSHRLEDASGRFIGLALIGISVDQFTEFYARLGESLGEGASITLYRRDFAILTCWPRKDELIGEKNLNGTPLQIMEKINKTSGVAHNEDPGSTESGASTSRIGAVRLVQRFPLLVSLTVADKLFLSNWRGAAKSIAGVTFGAVAALLFALVFLLRATRQRESSAALLANLADQVPGILFQLRLSPGGRMSLTYGNQKFLDLHGLHPEQLPVDGQAIFAYQHPDDGDRIRRSIQESARSLQPWHEDYRLLLPGREIDWRHGDATPQKLKDGTVLWHGYLADITELKQNQQRMENLVLEQKAMLENELVGIVLARKRTVIWTNPAFERMLGYAPGELIGTPSRQHYPSEVAFLAFGAAAYPALRAGRTFRTQTEHLRKDGNRIWVDVSGAMLDLENDNSLWCVSDISEQKRLEDDLAQSEQRMEFALAGAGLGVWDLDIRDGGITYNARLVAMLGYAPGKIEVNARALPPLLHPEDRAALAAAYFAHLKGETDSFAAEYRVRHRSGHWTWIQSRGKVIERDETGRAVRMTGTNLDTSERKANEEKIRKLAHYDPLTHLPNRALLSDRMAQALGQSARNNAIVTVCYLDLDGFKAINDELGHNAGDLVLIEVGQRLKDCVRSGDTVARLGGDEFVLLLVGAEGRRECEQAAARILRAIAAPIQIKGRQRSVSASVGIALFPDDGKDADTLLRHADQAMYVAKQSGKNRHVFFDSAPSNRPDEK